MSTSEQSPPPQARKPQSPRPLLLVGHGTRQAEGQREVLQVAKQFAAACPEYHVEPAFLELARPSIDDAVNRLTAAMPGVPLDPLIVAPLLLFAAGHAKKDIPAAVRAAIDRSRRAGQGRGQIFQASHLGCEPNLLALSTLRYEQSLSGRRPVTPEETLLVMVGRGSRDETATAEMHEFARLRVEATPVAAHRVCFVAMAEPGFQATLEALRDSLIAGNLSHIRRVVVQPHLLFQGEILEGIATKVAEVGRAGGAEWIVTAHLGPHPLLVAAIGQRLRERAMDASNLRN